ncbi:Mutanase [Tolypocladium paradoxum]|uniref:Mutanase n=1 Tax=Tolypocladium paradoxum TaxID=94208 RepID=A0A2S4KPU6_9HYPO|nr:Mutanase [Tolypocladium paradoxum]
MTRGSTRPHDGWLDLFKPFIAAYKDKAKSVNDYITEDKVIYWYRRTLRDLKCDSTDAISGRPANSGNYFQGRPNGWESMDDVVYVWWRRSSKKRAPSGPVRGQCKTENAPAGAHIFTVPAAVGPQTFKLTRGSGTVFEGTSLIDISNVCPCGIYNFNAYAGTLPAGFSGPLQSHGLASLSIGLHVTTCEAKPSLGTNPPGQVTATTTKPSQSPPTSTKTTSRPPVTIPPDGNEFPFS